MEPGLSKKPVCFINTASIWGGGESWQYETMMDLRDEVNLISISNPSGKLNQLAKDAGIKTYPFRSKNLSFLNPVKIFRAYKLLKRLDAHAVIFNTSNDFKMFTMPARWAGIEFRLYRRDNGKALRSHLLNKILLRRGITHFLPCSQFIGKAALSKDANLFPASKIETIYNSINLKKWDSQVNPALDIDRKSSEIIFGCIGRLSLEKGQLFLPPVAAIVKDKSRDFRILIAGTGPLKEELENLIEKTKVKDCIKLLGFVDSNKSFLESIDCLIIPSHWEGLSTVAIEAMAMHKPIIAFDVTSNSEVIHHGTTGFLAQPFNLEEVAFHMIHYIDNPAELKVMGDNGRYLAETTFSKEITNKQLMKYFF
jgi:glycosyltransferase involved in cell wall biosynthesis